MLLRASLWGMLMVGLAAGVGAQPLPGAVPPRSDATGEELRVAFAQGATLVGLMNGYIWVERYEPAGQLRGSYRGQAYTGRWSIEGDRLCTQATNEPRSCAIVFKTGRDIGDHVAVNLRLDDAQASTLQATYRAQAPAARPSEATSLTGEVVQVWQDGFLVAPQGGGPQVWVRAARADDGLFPPDRVTAQGTSDGIVFSASRVTRHPAARLVK